MQTQLSAEFQGSRAGLEAEAILRKCVHCGFCTATCPTYQLLGDELDGPRGRIYLMKEMLQGVSPTRATQTHLDRCLTCRNCESTCPSGVQYGQLLDIGRAVVEAKVTRPWSQRLVRWALKVGLNSTLFGPAYRLGQWLRPWLPRTLQAKVLPRQVPGLWPQRQHTHKVLLLAGCVQPAMAPQINAATARVLDAAHIQTVIAPQAACCGAIKFHLNDQVGALAQMRQNIDAWWPYVERGEVSAIVANASGCSVSLKDYGHALQDDSAYAAKAARISALARDLSELLPTLVPALQQHQPALKARVAQHGSSLVYHPPCTLQHGQQLRGGVEQGLTALGFRVQLASQEAHLCCGSAGTYSVLQADLAQQLRERKLKHLAQTGADTIISANIGCIAHLQSGTTTPVRHWVEVLDQALGTPHQA